MGLPRRKIGQRAMAGLAAAAILLALAVAFLLVSSPASPASASLKGNLRTIQTGLEERWGIQIHLVAVSAHGGIVDFRFKVVDPCRASFMLSDASTLPVLIAERDGTVLRPQSEAVKQPSLEAGQIYKSLYTNTNGVVRRGDRVTVQVGDSRIEHVTVE